MISGCAHRKAGVTTHVGRDEEVVVRELEIVTASENCRLAGEDVVGGHLRNRLDG